VNLRSTIFTLSVLSLVPLPFILSIYLADAAGLLMLLALSSAVFISLKTKINRLDSVAMLTFSYFLIRIFFNSSSQSFDLNYILLILRRIFAMSILLALPLINSFRRSLGENREYICNYSNTLNYVRIFNVTLCSIAIFSLASSCQNSYGGKCIILSESSSINSMYCVCAVLSSLYSLFIFRSNAINFLIAFVNIMLFLILGLSQSTRSFVAILALIGVINFFSFVGQASKQLLCQYKVKYQTLIIALITIILSFVGVVLINNLRLTSFARFVKLIYTMSDERLTDGYLLGTKDYSGDLDTISLFLGYPFSQLSHWSDTSAYDSSVNFFVSDYGVIGLTLILLFFAIVLKSQSYSARLLDSSMGNGAIAKHYSLNMSTSIILAYIFGSIPNELASLKIINSVFVSFYLYSVSIDIISRKNKK